jgi:hypothetical protein
MSILQPATVRLAGTGRAADDLYLIRHDDVAGKPQLHPRALGSGVIGRENT